MTTSATDTASPNPFPGLRPFLEAEEHLFFGRESQVDSLVDKLARTRFVTVVGTSGSGKSSLVNCGLRPALHRGLMATAGTSWRMVQCRPGSDPVRALARALASEASFFSGLDLDRASRLDIVDATLGMSKLGLVDLYEQARLPARTNLLIVIDQFEELFRYRDTAAPSTRDENHSQQSVSFVNLLLEPRAHPHVPIHIVLTMRSDFLGDCAQFPGLPEAINEGQYLVPRLTREERRAAIAGPIGVGRGAISPVLLTRLVNDVGGNPDQLSILQHALNRTWASWLHESTRDRELSLSHYEAIGTMAHALDRHAEKAYAELVTTQLRVVCEKIFKALTDRGTDARGIRRPTRVALLCELAEATHAEVTAVIDVFRKPSRSFLMPPLAEALEPETVIDISHESLMRVWERLTRWADEEAQSAQRYRRLSETATEYAAGKADLLRDPELQLSLDWRAATNPNAAWASLYGGAFEAAMSFLTASEEERARERRVEEERQQRELAQAQALAAERARSARRLRFALAGAVVLMIIAVVAAGWALKQRGEAERLGNIALVRQLVAQSVSLASTDVDAAALLAVEAMRRSHNLDTDVALRESTRRLAHERLRLRHAGPVRAVAVSPDARVMATASDDKDKTVRLLEVSTGKELWRQQLGALAKAIVYSADGRSLAIAGSDSLVRLLDTASGSEQWRRRLDGAVNSVAFSADGGSVATTSQDRTVRLFERATGTEVWRMDHTYGVTAALSADGRWIVTASETHVRVFDARTHQDVWNARQQEGIYGLFGGPGVAKAFALSPDSRLIAVARGYEFGERAWQVVEIATGQLVASGKGGSDAIAFSPNSRLVLFAGELVEADTGKAVSLIAGGTSAATLSFSPDGRMIATGDHAGVVRIIEAATGTEVERLTHQGAVTAVAFTADGRQVISASEDGTARVIDAPRPLSRLTSPGGNVNHVEFGPGARQVMTIGFNPLELSGLGPAQSMHVSDVATGKPVLRLTDSQLFGVVSAMDVDRSGRRLVLVTNLMELTMLQVFDTADGTKVWSMRASVSAVAFSPDGSVMATGGKDGVAMLDPATGKTIALLPQDRPVTALAFSADGRRLATGSQDSTRLFDVASRTELRRLDGGGQLAGITADGSRVVTVAGTTVRVFDAAGGRELSHATSPGPAGSLKVSGDGRALVVTAGNSARVFDAASGKETSKVTVADQVVAVIFVGEGRDLMVASLPRDTPEVGITRHHLHPQEMIDAACARLTRNLTAAEWAQYIGADSPYRLTCPSLQ